MRHSCKMLLGILILAILSATNLFSWDEGYLSLFAPVKIEGQMAVEPDLSVRMFDVFPPDRAGFRISDGVVLFDAAKLAVSYLTNQRELSAELSGWLSGGPFKFGVVVEGIWADDPMTAGIRYWSAAGALFAWGWIVPEVLNADLNVQYDIFYARLNLGLGLSLSVIPDTMSLVAEGLISPIGVFTWAWNAGVLIKTAGHQFLFCLGNGTDMRMRNTLAAGPTPSALAFGITVRRKIDIFFN